MLVEQALVSSPGIHTPQNTATANHIGLSATLPYLEHLPSIVPPHHLPLSLLPATKSARSRCPPKHQPPRKSRVHACSHTPPNHCRITKPIRIDRHEQTSRNGAEWSSTILLWPATTPTKPTPPGPLPPTARKLLSRRRQPIWHKRGPARDIPACNFIDTSPACQQCDETK
jgi:hypothetical protein